MSTLPEVLPFLCCQKINIKFINPTFCQARKAMKINSIRYGIILEDPSVVICHHCREPITILK